jgi:hypothetical protein
MSLAASFTPSLLPHNQLSLEPIAEDLFGWSYAHYYRHFTGEFHQQNN